MGEDISHIRTHIDGIFGTVYTFTTHQQDYMGKSHLS